MALYNYWGKTAWGYPRNSKPVGGWGYHDASWEWWASEWVDEAWNTNPNIDWDPSEFVFECVPIRAPEPSAELVPERDRGLVEYTLTRMVPAETEGTGGNASALSNPHSSIVPKATPKPLAKFGATPKAASLGFIIPTKAADRKSPEKKRPEGKPFSSGEWAMKQKLSSPGCGQKLSPPAVEKKPGKYLRNHGRIPFL